CSGIGPTCRNPSWPPGRGSSRSSIRAEATRHDRVGHFWWVVCGAGYLSRYLSKFRGCVYHLGHRVMDRRAFITVMGGSIAGVPLVSDAQQAAKMPRLGYLLLPPLSETPSPERAAFLAGLRDLGWIDGKTIAIEYRSANWTVELLDDLADELIRMKVDI